ncbi:MAG TPA: YraN family protein [Longimicrobiales bacterium]|nr:YraN family protein [Longimicrobiales bacterium]
MAAHNDFGAHAEDLAAALLERNGWTILHRNWRFGRREIDVIARRGRTIAFVEVKARRGVTHGHPLESIDWRKRRDLAIAASGWIDRHGTAGEEYRFDAVHVVARAGPGCRRGANDGPEVQHTEDAWSL